MTSLRRAIALCLIVVVTLLTDGCVSIAVSPSAAGTAGETGSLRVSIYAKPSDRDAGALVGTPVFSELFAVERGAERSVVRSMAAAWSLDDLPPGRYRIRVTKRIDEFGDVVELGSPGAKAFDIRPGERAEVAIVLRKVPVVGIVAAAVAATALTVLAIHLAKEGKLPLPHHLPPPPPLSVVIFTDFAFSRGRAVAGSEPGVADVFPARGSVIAARRVTVNYLLTAPLSSDGVEPGAVQALGTRSAEITGTVSYRPAEQLLRFAPDRDFQPDETVTVTLDLSKISGPEGRHGSGKVTTEFRVPPR